MVQNEMMGYMHIQGTRPQTLSYALTDSPVGHLGWIVEKFKEWTNPSNQYYETFHDPSAFAPKPRSAVPTGVAVFPGDVAIRRFAERTATIVRWSEFDRGGHFAAMEAPDLLVGNIRDFSCGLSA